MVMAMTTLDSTPAAARRSRPVRRALLGLAGLLALAPACHGQRDLPVPPIQTARPPQVPIPATPADPKLLGYLRVRDPARLASEFGDRARGTLASQGLDLNALRPGAPITLFGWDPAGQSMTKPPLAALVPLRPGSPAAQALADRAGGKDLTAPLKDQLLIAPTQTVLQRAIEQGPDLLALSTAASPFDAVLFLNLQSVLSLYGPQMRSGITMMQAAMALRSADSPAPGLSPQAMGGLLRRMVDQLESLKSLSLGVTFLPDDIEIASVTQDKAAQPAVPVAAPDLGRFLPQDPIRVQWNARDLSKKIGKIIDLYTPMIDEVPGLMAELRALQDLHGKIGHMYGAMSLSLGDGVVGYHGSGVILADDPQAYLAVVRKTLDLFKMPVVRDLYRKLGLEVTITPVPAQRKVLGWPVDRYEHRMAVAKDAPPAQRQLQEQVLAKMKLGQGTTIHEVAQVGRYVLFSLNTPAAGQSPGPATGPNSGIDTLVESLRRGTGGTELAASRQFPPGGSLYVDLDVAALFTSIQAMLPPAAAARLPTLPKGEPIAPVTISTYDSGPDSYYRVRVPRRLLRALGATTK